MKTAKKERHIQDKMELRRLKIHSVLCSENVTSVEKSRKAGQAPENFVFSYQPPYGLPR